MNERIHKGNSLLILPDSFVVLDLETTGLSNKFDEIIEISALRVRSFHVTDVFSTLIKPTFEISDEITEITGITNEMLFNAPLFSEIEFELREFIGDDYILGHNVNFDINFLYDNFYYPFRNDFIDTLRLSRRLLTELEHHKLKDVSEYFNIDYSKAHRAEQDCKITLECYKKLRKMALELYGDEESFASLAKSKKKSTSYKYNKFDIQELIENKSGKEDLNNYFYGKSCVFTGELKISRKEAMQLVINVGGTVTERVTKKTNILVVSESDRFISNKQKKAEEYIEKGLDIAILNADRFYEEFNL